MVGQQEALLIKNKNITKQNKTQKQTNTQNKNKTRQNQTNKTKQNTNKQKHQCVMYPPGTAEYCSFYTAVKLSIFLSGPFVKTSFLLCLSFVALVKINTSTWNNALFRITDFGNTFRNSISMDNVIVFQNLKNCWTIICPMTINKYLP